MTLPLGATQQNSPKSQAQSRNFQPTVDIAGIRSNISVQIHGDRHITTNIQLPQEDRESDGGLNQEGETLAMAEELFLSDPISYRMDRNSPAAFKLRDAVNKKLFDFLGNYSDDGVLAEYIVVLVCNGKHQNQARDDLEAFLGDDSANFVAWLWDYLAKENYISRAPLGFSLKDEVSRIHEDCSYKEWKSSRLTDCHTQSPGMPDIPLPPNGRYNGSNHAINSNNLEAIQVPESLHRWCPSINASLTEESTGRLQAHLNEVKSERLKSEQVVRNNDSHSTYHSGATKQFSSTVRCSSELPSGDERLNNRYQQQKIAKINSSAVLRRPLPVPRTEQAMRGLRSVITDNHQLRPLPVRGSGKIRLQSTAIDSEAYQTARPRGNVWDRLGKPQNEDSAEMRGMTNLCDNHLIKRYILDFQGDELRNTRSIHIKQDDGLSSNIAGESVGLDNNCNRVVLNSTECRKLVHNSNYSSGLPHLNNSKRKRLYNESNSGNSSASFPVCKENLLRVKEVPPRMQDSISVKYARSNKVVSEANGLAKLFSESTHNSVFYPRVRQNSQADKVDVVISSSLEHNASADKVSPGQLFTNDSGVTQTQKVHPNNTRLLSNLESPRTAERAIVTRRQVKDEVLDVRSKLCQMETNMLKLHSKKAEMRIDVKPNTLEGMQHHSDEDIESRTVLVTNVHFAATREALLSHFSKCGAVAKVVMLTDTITAQPKGAAYIVFANKDSVDMAVSMSRTSFFSRILTVIRKADVPPDFLVPSQSAGELMQPCHARPFWKRSGQRNYSSSRLQWRRENPTNR